MALPEDFQRLMAEQLGASEAAALFAALLDTVPPTSVRVNAAKWALRSAGAALAPTAAPLPAVPWCAAGCYLPARPQFTLDPLLHAGCYYVQEAASMAVPAIVPGLSGGGEGGLAVLDLCAAPGGKSTHWASRLAGTQSLLVCNEPVRSRANVLAENLTKWGQPDVVVTNAYPKDFAPLADFFDVVAADVPCSGEGMFRKDPASRAEWSMANVQMCAERQRSIIADVWPALRQGGLLVYSTCTFNRFEDEDNVRWICSELGADVVPLEPMPDSVVGDLTGHGLPVAHFFPHRTQGEGFFLAVLRKRATDAVGTAAARSPRSKKAPAQLAGRDAEALRSWLAHPSDFSLLSPDAESVFAVRTALLPAVQRLVATLGAGRIVQQGVHVAQLKGHKWQPAQGLALSAELAADAFPRAELTLQQALAYLRRDAITLEAGVPRGHVVVAYEGHPLGFVNNLGTRANNLYPAEWRIRRQL